MGADAVTQTQGGAIDYRAGGDLQLARVDAASGAVTLQASGTISSAPGFSGANVTSGSLDLQAGTGFSLDSQVSGTISTTTASGIGVVRDSSGRVAGNAVGDTATNQVTKNLVEGVSQSAVSEDKVADNTGALVVADNEDEKDAKKAKKAKVCN
jgi:hypothetical protein